MENRLSQQKLDQEEVAMRIFLLATHLLRHERGGAPSDSLRAPKLSTLQTLVEHGSIDLEELAMAERVQAPSLHETLEMLGRRGFITKNPNRTGDRRRVTIRITPA